MTLEAGWAVIGADGSYRGVNVTVRTVADVDELVRRLAEPGAEVARLIHHGRPLWDAERGFVDHDVYAVVAAGFGYLSCQDATRAKRSIPSVTFAHRGASSTTRSSLLVAGCPSNPSRRP